MHTGHTPKISVVMAVYNEKDYVSDAIESILSQEFHDFEFIIIDDGSNDSTRMIIAKYKDPRIRTYKQQNRGLPFSIARGVNLAKGKYIARIDGDDIAHKKRFSIQLDYLEKHKDVGMIGSYAYINDLSDGNTYVYKPPIDYKSIMIHMLRDNPMIHSSLMFRKTAYKKIGGYNPGIRLSEDYDLCIRMAEKYKICNLPEVLITRRVLKNHSKKPCWNKYFKYQLYAIRLRYQLQASKKLPFHFTAPIYILKTALQVIFERVKNEIEKLQQARF